MLSTLHTQHRAPLMALLLLILTLLQASSFNLSLAFRGPLASDSLVSLITLLWLAMYAIAAFGLFISFGINWITWLVRYRLLLTCLLAGAAFSVSWSVDSALSIERSVHLIGTTLVAIYLGFSLPLNHILRTTAVVLGFIMVASALAALLVPELGLEQYQGRLVWTGVLASKNTLGFWAAVSVLLCTSLIFWTLPSGRKLLYAAIAVVSLLCLYNSVSATSLLALVSGALIMIYLHIAFSLRLSMLAMMFLGALVVSMLSLAFYFIDTAELIGRSGDLTGRGEVWAQTWKLILERPLTGYGYGTLWYPTPDSLWIQQSLTDFSWTVFHAHNGLLQIASEIGLPLTAIALLMIMQQLVEIIYCHYQRQQPGVLFVLGFTVALLVSNYSEARLLVNRELYWVMFVALPVSMLRQISVTGTVSDYSTRTSQTASHDELKRRQARERKAHKLTIKERIKQHSGLKVINPVNASDRNGNAESQTHELRNTQVGKRKTVDHGKHDDGTSEQEISNASQSRPVNRAEILRLKKIRRNKKAG